MNVECINECFNFNWSTTIYAIFIRELEAGNIILKASSLVPITNTATACYYYTTHTNTIPIDRYHDDGHETTDRFDLRVAKDCSTCCLCGGCAAKQLASGR